MSSKFAVFCIVAIFAMQVNTTAMAAGKRVAVTPDEAHQRVDITIDGAPFTSYIWPTTLKKPVLYPLIAPDGMVLTRGYPLEPRPGERVDHPHHAGLWFNYSNVNGFDFWNNSDAIKPENRNKMGTIHQDRIVSTKSGRNSGELVVDSTWTTGANQDIIKETTRYVFARHKDQRSIDMIITLQALDHVVFNDDKDGLLGIRVAHFLELPNEPAGVFVDSNGVQTTVAGTVPGATGNYLTSEGKSGDAAWGTRGRWCILTGNTDGKTATIGVLDHPENPDYPTYWHARGYGLFAVNPLGAGKFDTKQPPLNFTLEKNQTATFRYRILFFSRAVTPDEMNHDADAFAAKYK